MSPNVQLSSGHRLGLLPGGDALFAALEQAMDAAQVSVHLETYIFHFKGAPLRVAEALERAAQRGVAVRLVVDGVGTGALPADWTDRFVRAGVDVKVYAPLGKLGLLLPSRWRRLHRKLCVIDGVLGFCGGINLLDDRLALPDNPLQQPRFDFAVRCVGPLVETMADTMLQLWWRMQAMRRARQHEFRAAWLALKAGKPVGDFSDWRVSAPLVGWRWRQPPPQVDNAQATLVLRDNVWHRADIERAYLWAIRTAQHEVLLANAYFVPGGRMRRALVQAVARGVRVRVLTQGRYEGFMQYHAARPVYRGLLDAGVDIREYTPSDLHAKVAVVDGRWATVGSSNLDPLSLLLAREANVVTSDARFAADLRERLHDALAHASRPVDHQALLNQPWSRRVQDRLAFALMRLAIFLSGHRY